MTTSTEKAAPPKPTTSRNSESSVSRGTHSNPNFGLIWICSEKFEFLLIGWILGVYRFQWNLSYEWTWHHRYEECMLHHTREWDTSSMCASITPETHCTSLHHTATQCATLVNEAGRACAPAPLTSAPNQHHTATHCNTLQHAATRCNTLQQNAPLASAHIHVSNTLQHTATHCNTMCS